ncbi:dual specificity protein phosphatase family protein [Catenulispora yoronensis]|uniref:Dual specificity protein phosphatase family protein n=1 Tax=Catenulispora yoronensis TaxID=450799 RepID=A0ABP5GST9_9ACTN
MRTKDHSRGHGGYGDAPEEPWSEIVPGLWMGGHEYIGADGMWTEAVVVDEFDAVYSLHNREGHGPADGVDHHVLEVPDDALTAEQIRAVEEFAAAAQRDFAARRLVLVRCRAGMNRSGLVVASVLIRSGFTPRDAIATIRRQRAARALNNEHFVAYLETGLDLAAQLTGLGAAE